MCLPLLLALAVPAVAARSYVTQIPELLASSPASDWQRIDDYRRVAALPNAE